MLCHTGGAGAADPDTKHEEHHTMTNTNRTPWTEAENAALSRLYFAMLDAQAAMTEHGMTYNKAGMIRHYRGEALGAWLDGEDHGSLSNRTRGSIEAKLMNASAAHRDILAAGGIANATALTMDGHGYRCLPNYQKALKDAIAADVTRRYMDNPFADGAVIA
jgi:hypothetical protein